MKNINLFSGPGVGKSFTAAGLFYEMKKLKLNVEYIQEYAKDLTYGDDFVKLSDQLLILGEQHHRMKRLINKVNYVIHDSPFIMGLAYIEQDEFLPKEEYKNLIISMYKRYNNFNVFLERNTNISYEESGRNQSLEEAILKDKEVKAILDENNIEYVILKMDENILKNLLELILD